jgi:porphobilinogen synthase
MLHRPRRNRKSAPIRNLIEETHLRASQLILPLFLLEGKNRKEEIMSLPGTFRMSLDNILKTIEECLQYGVYIFDIFPVVPEHYKDHLATYSYQENNFYLESIYQIKKEFPQAILMSDVAMDPYSSDGHDGIYEDGKIINDSTLEILGKMAVAQAQAGIDIVGPSDMMDGRVQHIREQLDIHHFEDTSIMAYSAKYASSFYGPFRDALASAPKFGDKKTYQLNPTNTKEALLEAQLDEQEGADFVMIKPALTYLDIIHQVAERTYLPVTAYHVSGECAMLIAAAEKGWVDRTKAIHEVLTSISRAGATGIITYFALEYSKWLKQNS